MKLYINGEERDFAAVPAAFTLFALVERLGIKPDRVAVELNRDIVSRERWSETTLNEGDRLEVVHFVGGGCWSRPVSNVILSGEASRRSRPAGQSNDPYGRLGGR